ncbi:hypothetical protein BGZ47_002362, partial [Haplosporangium gracile]
MITYGVWAEDKLLPDVAKFKGLIKNTFDYWKSKCGPDGRGRAVWGSISSYTHKKVPIQQKDRDGGSSGYCLDADMSSSGAATMLNTCNGSNQKWELNSDGTIRSPSAGMCLDNMAQQLVVGNKIQAWDCVNAWSEKWWIC